MPGRNVTFGNGEFYHVYNRGSDKRNIFIQPRDYKRFQQTFYYYQFLGPKLKFSNFAKSGLQSFKPAPDSELVEIICYCLMPNHFHFLVRQLKDSGISIFISQLSNSYTKYFNTKYKRVGALLQGSFKAVHVESDEQLIHLSRYIHLNPIVSGLSKSLSSYSWSSYPNYLNQTSVLCSPTPVLNLFSSTQKYKEFTEDQIDYGTTLEILKHQVIEEV
ncbi:transposase [Candidatus Daviesbacteria bacterium]|nr:transposase [Candidatus Daviesbacteria bacterium]